MQSSRLLPDQGSGPVTPDRLDEEWNSLEKLSRKPKPAPTTDLFIAVPRRQIMRLAKMLPTWRQAAQSAESDFTKVEKLRAMNVNDRLKKINSRGKELPLEVVIHAGPDRASAFILEGLEAYLDELNVKARYDKKFHVDRLWFSRRSHSRCHSKNRGVLLCPRCPGVAAPPHPIAAHFHGPTCNADRLA